MLNRSVAMRRTLVHVFLARAQIFFRALRNCPWSKALCMDGLEMPALSGEDKQTVMELIGEKGLSIRHPYEPPARVAILQRIISQR